MTTAHVFIATSLDGFIAREDGGIDWLDVAGAEPEDHGYAAFYAGIDGILMGRGTWEKVLSFGAWPYDKPVVVLSRSLMEADVPATLAGKVRIWREAPRAALDRVADEGWARAYVDGGQLIQSFLREGLIADMVLTRIPVLLGEGRSLFGSLPVDIPLHHVRTQSFASGLVQSQYRISPQVAGPEVSSSSSSSPTSCTPSSASRSNSPSR